MWLILTMLCCVFPTSLTKHEDCTVESSSGTYDFSGLSWEPWIVMDIENTSLDYASVSLCNRTHLTPCGVVSICVVGKNNSTWSALDSSFIVENKINNTEIKVSARLKETYIATVTTITVDVTFICDEKVGELHFKKFENNVLFLLWRTVAACTIKSPSPYYNCIINDTRFGKINLRPLRHLQYYNTTDKQNKYYVNICGGTVGSVCGNIEDVAGCEIDSENKTQILGFASKQTVKGLYLEFRNKSRKNVLRIEFVCNSSIPHGKLKFKSDANSAHIFELETSLACISKLRDCSYEDEDHLKYNLTSLSELEDSVYHKDNARYILSVCRSVKHSICSNGSSICLINGTSAVSLGSLSYGPKIESGNLRISSSGGDYCNVHNLRYRSVIIFICSETKKPLTLANVSLECVYTFMWYSKAACPSISEIGSDCSVRDELHGLTFDLKPLYNPNGNYIIVNENGNSLFDLNVCEEISKPCNGSRNVGVCLTDQQGRQYPIGNRAVSPHYDDGRLSFVLEGKGCRSDQMSSTVHIIFLCSQSAIKSNPEFYGQSENCTFFFVWHTVLACGTFKAYDCKITGNTGQTYDLRPLSKPDEDYIILSNTTKGYRKFFINVCRPVIFRHDARCSPQSGICLRDLTEPNYHKSFTSLGDASGLQYDKDKNALKLEYNGGGICRRGAEAEFRSVITFICDKKGIKSSSPTLSKESGCLYEFEWKTNLVCPKEETDIPYSNCKLFNFHQGIILDLSSFTAHEQFAKSSSGEVFRFVVCGSLNNTNTKGVGICQEKGGNCENIGMGNTDLHYEKGRLYLNYTNGVNCTANARKYTIIEFICDTKEMVEIIYSMPCEYTIKWHSNVACVVPCITEGQRKINLSILSNNENNYKTIINGTSYFINVCKPLVREEGLNCSNGSAVCKAVHQSERNWSDEVDLGHSQYRPTFLGGNVVLNYSSTSSCTSNSSQNRESSIIFVCDPLSGFGAPILHHIYSNCKYEFLWNTSVICEDYIFLFGNTHSDKILNNSLSKTLINLEPLCRSTKYKVKNYFIHMCNSFLCKIEKLEDQKEISYGTAEYAAFSYSENVTKLFISGGDECHIRSSETYSAVIILTCTINTENHIEILKELDCTVVFEWRTPVACSHSSTTADHKEITSANITKSQTSIVAVVMAIILTVVACLIVYFLNKPASRNWCRININRLFSRRHDGEFHYTLRNPDSFELSSAESL